MLTISHFVAPGNSPAEGFTITRCLPPHVAVFAEFKANSTHELLTLLVDALRVPETTARAALQRLESEDFVTVAPTE